MSIANAKQFEFFVGMANPQMGAHFAGAVKPSSWLSRKSGSLKSGLSNEDWKPAKCVTSLPKRFTPS
jgi:hypothetical protein